MPWSPEQVSVLEQVTFRPQRGGYERADVERMRTRALLTMRRGHPLPDLDAMPLRRTPRVGLSVREVEGVRTLLAVWARTTDVEDPREQAQRERDAQIAALAAQDEASTPQWSAEQLDRVREKHFTRVGRRRTAYEERDVNAYLDSVVAAMRQGADIPDPAHTTFESAGMRRGYDCREVDEFLDELEHMKREG